MTEAHEGYEGNEGHENGDELQAAIQRVSDYGDGEVSRARLPYKAHKCLQSMQPM